MTLARRNLLAALISMALGAATSYVLAAAEYGDVTYERKATTASAEEVPVAVFPHWIHRMQYKCPACHDALFKMKAGAGEPITMDAIREGRFCGVCHNGRKAFESSFDTCARCHRQ
jgi:c(7)-type cytochrome triheme protein